MADVILTAPKWWTNKWQWIPRALLRYVICVSMNFDPDDPPADLRDLVHRRRVVRSYGINGPPIRAPNWSGAQIQRRKEFADRSAILRSQLYAKAAGDVFDLRACAAVLARTGRRELAELFAIADEQVAKTTDRPCSGKRTDSAIATVKARRANRLQDMSRFFDDVYEAANQGDFNLGSGNDRKELPFSRRDLRAVFLGRHPEHEIAQATFNDDLPEISVKVQSGRKFRDIKYLKALLAK